MDSTRGAGSGIDPDSPAGIIPRQHLFPAAGSNAVWCGWKRSVYVMLNYVDYDGDDNGLTTLALCLIVTGGTGVLALASARALLEHGLSGIVLLDLPAALEKGKAAVDSLRTDFPAAKIMAEQCDVTDSGGIHEVVQKAREQLGELTILCCFAGMVNCAAAENLPIEQWKRVLDVNTTGSWIAAQTVGRYVSQSLLAILDV